MELLRSIHLCGTQIKEWASSNIGYLTPTLSSLYLEPSLQPLQNQKELCLSDYPIKLTALVEWNSHFKRCFTGIEHLFLIGGGINLAHLLIGIPHMRDLKSLSLRNPTNLAIDEIYSSIGYFTGLEKLQLCARPIFNNSYLDGFSFYFSSTLQELDLSRSVIVELPPSMQSFVKLRILTLFSCNKLQEILHLPPNIQELDAQDCFSMERCPEVSTKFTFYTCDLRELRWINLNRCKKLDANIGSQAPDPSFVEEHIQDHSCGITFPGNKIPDWFSHTKETSYSHSCELDISGPLYLDKIIGIVLCVVLGKDSDGSDGVATNIHVSINGNRLTKSEEAFFIPDDSDDDDSDDGDSDDGDWFIPNYRLVQTEFFMRDDWDHVYLNYSFPESIEKWLRYPTGDNLRFIFESEWQEPVIKSCGVHIIYKHEENESLMVGKCSVDSSNSIQLSKRHRDDEDNNLEFNGHPQHKWCSQNLGNSNVVDGDFAEAEGGSEGSLKEEEVPASRSASQEGQGNSEKAD